MVPVSSKECHFDSWFSLHMIRKSFLIIIIPKKNLVSIGPIHHKGEGLEAMEEYKQRHFAVFPGDGQP